ncbi:MAG: type II toxin-antitoxin system ParD family antitoxin [Psychrosphaera sp.]|nr:type II toxin-antitoxin system ParD family antitoxin [Psychrosphaera sp.]
MANISVNLGEHWEVFIKNEVSSGRYGSASEVVEDALRTMAAGTTKLEALRSHLDQGEQQVQRGEFVEDFSMDSLIQELDDEV